VYMSRPERDWLCRHDDGSDPLWRRLQEGLSIRGCTGPAPGHARIALCGEVHAFSERGLENALGELLDGGLTSLHVDLADAVFLDGAGARTLAATAQRLEACGGRLRVLQPAVSVSKTLEMTGLGRLLAPPSEA
jgi:anti-anti-sigma factor